jgi:hypothetical protein
VNVDPLTAAVRARTRRAPRQAGRKRPRATDRSGSKGAPEAPEWIGCRRAQSDRRRARCTVDWREEPLYTSAATGCDWRAVAVANVRAGAVFAIGATIGAYHCTIHPVMVGAIKGQWGVDRRSFALEHSQRSPEERFAQLPRLHQSLSGPMSGASRCTV